MVWSPSCDSVGVQVNTPADVMAAPDGNVPSNENVKESSSDAVAVKVSSTNSFTVWSPMVFSTGATLTSRTVTVNVSESVRLPSVT